jgi:hypothetical protein
MLVTHKSAQSHAPATLMTPTTSYATRFTI